MIIHLYIFTALLLYAANNGPAVYVVQMQMIMYVNQSDMIHITVQIVIFRTLDIYEYIRKKDRKTQTDFSNEEKKMEKL